MLNFLFAGVTKLCEKFTIFDLFVRQLPNLQTGVILPQWLFLLRLVDTAKVGLVAEKCLV